MNILFLSSWYPYPPDNGSKLRVYNLLRALAKKHTIFLISFAERPPTNPPPELKALCQEIYAVPRPAYNPGSARALTGLLSLTPRSVLDTYQPLMAAQIEKVLQEKAIDLVIASQWRTAAYQTTFAHIPAIYEEVETGVLSSKVTQAASPLQRLRHYLPLLKLRVYLRRLLPRFQASTVVSEDEKGLLRELVPDYKAVHVVPNGIYSADYDDVQVTPQPETLIFTGALSYFANLEGIQWFLSEVYPIVQAEVSAVKLVITGKNDGISLTTADNVTLTGFVEDIRPLIASARVSIAPLLVGGGTRLKILEAMALGTPIVTTTKGVEGLRAVDGEHLLIADTPAQFADAVIRLLQDGKLCRKLADNSCRLVRQQYDWSVIMPDFMKLTEEVIHV